MIKIIKNKKAQEASTLVWILATLIIFFIILFFVLIVGLLAAKQKITLSEPKIIKIGVKEKADLSMTISLISFLKTKVSGETMQDLILTSLDVYVTAGGNLERRPDYPDSAFLKITEVKDKLVLKNSHDILSKFCENYMLEVPQGVIVKGNDNFVSKSVAESFVGTETLTIGWTSWTEIEIPYKNQAIKVKYKQLKKC